MKGTKRTDIKFHPFLTSTLDADEWSANVSAFLLSRNEPLVPVEEVT
jgi:hypothetical protein